MTCQLLGNSAQLVVAGAILAVGALAGCESSLLHDVPSRQLPTDINNCAPNLAPTDLRARATASEITLTWVDKASNEAGYIVDRSDGDARFLPLIQLGPNADRFNDTGAQLDHPYRYRVKAYRVAADNRVCETDNSNELSTFGLPHPPRDLKGALPNASGEIRIQWIDDNNWETGYLVQRFDETEGAYVDLETVPPETAPVTPGNGNLMFYSDTFGVLPSAEMEYRVFAVNPGGRSISDGTVARAASAPVNDWTLPPHLDADCTLVIPGSTTVDTTSGATFASAVGTIDKGVAAVQAGADGIGGQITDLAADVPFATSWQVTDSLGGTSTIINRQLALHVMDAQTRANDRAPSVARFGEGVAGAQALQAGCGGCTGQRGAVAVGSHHSCAITAGGTVTCWGRASESQLGHGVPTEAAHAGPVCTGPVDAPCRESLGDLVALAADRAACAVTVGGEVLCWGSNSSGMLGVGHTSLELGNFPYPTAPCASGTLLDGDCVPLSIASTSSEVPVAVGYDHVCIVLTAGRVACWGDNGNGAIGVGWHGDDFLRPGVACATGTWDPASFSCTGGALLQDVVAVTAGYDHSCALREVTGTRSVTCWGDNYYGQLGDGTTTDRDNPTAVCATGSSTGTCTPLTNVVSISAGRYHTCALLDTGAVHCWGRNDSAQLGLGLANSTRYSNPVPVCAAGVWDGATCDDGIGDARLAGATAVDAGTDATCALLADQSVRCWGQRGTGSLGDGSTGRRNNPSPVCRTGSAAAGTCQLLSGATSISTGSYTSCATVRDGSIACWGKNTNGAVGRGDLATTDVANTVCSAGLGGSCARVLSARDVTAGDDFACGLVTAGTLGTARAVCWGTNGNGTLGRGSVDHATSPQRVCVEGTGQTCVELDRVVSLASGFQHSCAVRADGSVWCWGDPWYGFSFEFLASLGLGNVRVARAHATPVCATGEWDGMRCTGQALTGAVSVAAGFYTTCVLMADGQPRCWGFNECAQTGNGDAGTCGSSLNFWPSVHNPTPVCLDGTIQPLCDELSGVIQLDTGGWHSCAVTEVGEAWCWGANDWGQLGNGTTATYEISPVPVCAAGSGLGCARLDRVRAIYTGINHTCALRGEGELWCWGSNASGQLGIGTFLDRLLPSRVCAAGSGSGCAPLLGVVGADAGFEMTCAILASGELRCWGFSEEGESGAGVAGFASDGPYLTLPTPVCAPDDPLDCTPDPICRQILGDVVAVSTYINHSCALLADGSLRCWGYRHPYGNAMGNTMLDGGGGPICRPVPVCASGGGRQCESGSLFRNAGVQTCDALEVIVP